MNSLSDGLKNILNPRKFGEIKEKSYLEAENSMQIAQLENDLSELESWLEEKKNKMNKIRTEMQAKIDKLEAENAELRAKMLI